MTYLAFDLDALNVAADLGRAVGVPEERITHGLLRLWAWCFRSKTETVDETQVRGFFGAEATTALISFGFLEPQKDNFRVRGADRYLRITEARRRGGLMSKKNIISDVYSKKQAQKRTKTSSNPAPAGAPAELKLGSSSAQARLQPELKLGSSPALTPSTEHRAPNIKRLVEDQKNDEPKISDLLCEDFVSIIGSKYFWQGAKDSVALEKLKKHSGIEEIRSRWKLGLTQDSKSWKSCRTVAQLALKWNELAPEEKQSFVSIEHRPSRIFE